MPLVYNFFNKYFNVFKKIEKKPEYWKFKKGKKKEEEKENKAIK